MLPAIFTLLSVIAGAEPLANPNVRIESRTTGFVTRTVKVDSTEYAYQVYVPATAAKQKLPVVLFLHGIGQRGEGGIMPESGAARAFAENYMKRIPAIIVLPQCRRGKYWWDADMTRMTMGALNRTIEEFSGDTSRVSLVGVSMGGYGAWHLAAENKEKFARVVPICGGSPERGADRFARLARRIGSTPVWVFHGAEDRVVPVSESRGMVEALKAAGGNVRYNEYPKVGHNVWMNVLGEQELLPWLLKQ